MSKVLLIVEDEKDMGYHSVVWSGKDEIGEAVNSGVYIYVFQSNDYRETKKMLLVK